MERDGGATAIRVAERYIALEAFQAATAATLVIPDKFEQIRLLLKIATQLQQSKLPVFKTDSRKVLAAAYKIATSIRPTTKESITTIIRIAEFQIGADDREGARQSLAHTENVLEKRRFMGRDQLRADLAAALVLIDDPVAAQAIVRSTIDIGPKARAIASIARASAQKGNMEAAVSLFTLAYEQIEKIKDTGVDSAETYEKLKLYEDEKRLNESRKEELVNDRELYGVAVNMLKDDGIKKKIIKQYVPVMNKLINKYLAALDFFVLFQLDEQFNEIIKSRHRDEFSYASFSEGEKMRIDLALLFTWRSIAKLKNSINTNLLILDEVFDASLDNNGCDEFLKLLNQLDNQTNVFVISHKGDILSEKFKHQIRFEKYKNFSRVA